MKIFEAELTDSCCICHPLKASALRSLRGHLAFELSPLF